MLIKLVNGVFVADSSYAEKDAVKQAGFWWHGGGCRPGCKACAAGLGLKVWWTFKPEAAARLIEYATDEAKLALNPHVNAVNASRATDVAPDAEVNLPVPDGLSYLGYQKAGITVAVKRKRLLIADEMGLGKTIQVLGLINADDSIKTVLIICPASLRLNWEREARKWLLRGFKYHIVDENAAPPEDATFVIVPASRIAGKNGSNVFPALMARKWDLVAADEAHFFKNPDAKRTQAMLGIPAKRNKTTREMMPAQPGLQHRGDRFVPVTGTPFLNKPVEIWPLLNALDPVTWGNFFAFAKRYCGAKQVQAGRKLVWDFNGASNLGELQERLRATVMVRRLKKDVLTELPPKRRQIVLLPKNGASEAVEAEAQAWAAHEEKLSALRQEADLAHAAGDKEAYERAVAAMHAAKNVAFTEISAERARVAVAKIPACIEHLHGLLDEGVGKVVVFAHHHEVLDALAREFGQNAVTLDGRTPMADRQAAVDRFQTDPTCNMFIGGIQAAGVGLTLTAASTVVFCELDWVPANVSQAEDRCHRIGQLCSVNVQHLVLDGSLDARMAEIIVLKQNVAEQALDTMAVEIKVPAIPNEGTPRPPKYPVATKEKREAAALAMRMLAGVCDGAAKLDDMGFSKIDASAGHRLARLGRPYTDGEVWYATKLARKYRRQLPSTIRDTLEINPN